MKRRTILQAAPGGLLAIGLSTPQAVAASSQYSPTGEYLDYATRSNIGAGSNVRLDGAGVIQVKRGSTYVYNPTTIAQYGLQQYTYYRRSRDSKNLHRAVVQAGWLIKHMDAVTGRLNYDYPFGVGGMSETLKAGWASAMAQGQAMSLLTRIYHAYPTKTGYRSAAVKALRPLRRSVADGGLRATFHGHTYLEEYPTRTAPSLALNGFQFTLVGLYDLAQTGDKTAKTTFDEGFNTLVFALPYHDAVTTSAYHLGHLTKPPRSIHHAAHYHRIHVMLLDALRSVRPHPTLTAYANLWRTYPDMKTTVRSIVSAG